MLQGVKTTSALNQLKKEGIWYLYRGMLPPLIQKSLSMSVMFGVYGECLTPLLDRQINAYFAKTVAGMVSGCAEATLMPFERMQTLLIHPKYHNKFKNTLDAAQHLARHYGIKEFYRGLVPVLLRNGPLNALFFILRDEVRNRVPTRESMFVQSVQNFVSGAFIGAMLNTMIYPVNVLKIAMQTEIGGPHRSVGYEFKYVLHKRGGKLINFYHGALLNIFRAFLNWGIINTSYEIFRKLLYRKKDI